jgi:hypothetical protein
MILANTILAGAQKSGTTALCRFLERHPQCFVSKPKESNFFSRAANISLLDQYARCFRAAVPAHRIRIDGTTTYMADPAIPQRIRDCLGDDTRIIFVLRNPAARTYSSFLHMLKRGHERRPAEEVFLCLPDDPTAALAAERAAIDTAVRSGRIADRPYRRLYDDVLWNYRYVGNSMYSSLIQTYTNVFGPKNILILYFEEITVNMAGAREALGAFLEIDQEGFPAALTKDNATRIPNLSTPWGWLIEQARWIKRGNITLVRPREIGASPEMPSRAVRQKLDCIFAGEVAYWLERRGQNLSW